MSRKGTKNTSQKPSKDSLPKGLWKRGNVYWITLTDPVAGRIQESTGLTRLDLALKRYSQVVTELAEQRYFPQKGKYNIDFKTLETQYLSHPKTLRKKTVKDDRQRFKRILEYFKPNTRVLSIDADDVVRFQDWLTRQPNITRPGKALSGTTVNRHIMLLKTAINRCVGLQPYWQPFSKVEAFDESVNERTNTISDSNFELLFNAANIDIKLFLLFGGTYGLRLSSILNLTWDMIDLDNSTIYFPAGYLKNKKPLPLPLTPRLKSFLIERSKLKSLQREDGRLFYPYHPSTISGMFRQLANKTNIKGTFHDLRRTAATNLRRQGVPTSTVMDIVGWKSIQMFQKYDQINMDDKVEALKKLPIFQ